MPADIVSTHHRQHVTGEKVDGLLHLGCCGRVPKPDWPGQLGGGRRLHSDTRLRTPLREYPLRQPFRKRVHVGCAVAGQMSSFVGGVAHQ